MRALLGFLLALLVGTSQGAVVNPPGLAPSQNLADAASRSATAKNVGTINVTNRPPTANDDTTKGYAVGNLWCIQSPYKCWVATTSVAAGAALWLPMDIGYALPLDIAAAAGYTAQGWWGDQLVTRNANVITLNKWADWWRNTDGTTKTIGWAANGDADWQALDGFCAGATSCEKSKSYDQSFNIATGALTSNDATQTPGIGVISATVTTGGTGCTAGAQTFTVTGGSGTPAQIAGTVTGTTLSGALTVPVPGSYWVVPVAWTAGLGKSTVSLSGGGCATPPTVFATYYARSPHNKLNTINGHRATTWTPTYSPGDPTLNTGLLGGQIMWMDLPAGVAVAQNTITMFHAIHPRHTFTTRNLLTLLGTFAADFDVNLTLGASLSPFLPTPSFFTHIGDTPFGSPTSAAVWTWQLGAATTNVSAANLTETMTFVLGGAAKTGGALGAGGTGGGRIADYDMLHTGVFNSIISAPVLANMKASLNLVTGMVPQSTDLLVIVGDSISVSITSLTGNNWAKYMTGLGLLSTKPMIVNASVSGGSYVSGPYDFTANFAAMWAPIYRPNVQIYPVLTLGRNDLLVGPPASPAEVTVFLRAKAYTTLLAALGTNVHPIVATTLPDMSKAIADPPTQVINTGIINAFNTLVRNCAMLARAVVTTACPNGGLGAVAVIDFAADALWSSTAANDSSFAYTAEGTHPRDTGSQDSAGTAAPIIDEILRKNVNAR